MSAVFALLNAVSFASGSIFTRKGMNRSQDNGVFMITLVTLVVFTAATAWLALAGALPPLRWQGVAAFVAAGLFTSFLGRILATKGIRLIGPSRSGSYKKTSPIWSMVLAYVFLGERVGPVALLGIAAVLVGIFLLTREQDAEARPGVRPIEGGSGLPTRAAQQVSWSTPPLPAWHRLGDHLTPGVLIALAAGASYGTGHFLRKLGLLYMPSPFVGACIGTWVSFLLLLGGMAAEGRDGWQRTWRNNFAPFNWLFVASGFCTVAGQLTNFLALVEGKVAIITVLMSTETLWTYLLSWFFLRQEERVTPRLVGAGALVFAGVVTLLLSR